MRAASLAFLALLCATGAPAADCGGDVLCQYRADKAARIARENAASDALCRKIGGAKIGMTASAARASCWGKPRSINETRTARGNHEQWVYGGGYLYFDDGILTSIQTSR